MNEFSLSDLAAVTGGNRDGDGWNNGGGWWILLLFILLGGFNNRGYGQGYGAGNVGGNELYPWLNNAENVNGGFRDQMLQTGIQGIGNQVQNLATQLCGCCGDLQMALANGFAGVNLGLANGFAGVNAGIANGFNQAEIAANGRQMANMQQQFGMQTAMMQGFNSAQAQLAECCCENRLATANQTATILAEHCADRAALSDATRDIIAGNLSNTQRILDKLCEQELAAANRELAAERRENDNLRQQINLLNLAASQGQQTAQILADNASQTNALEQYLAPVPRPAYIVQNPNCCGQAYGCGCAA